MASGGAPTVLALDNVPLALPVAGLGPRALAVFLDYLLVGVLTVGWIVAVVAIGAVLGDRAWIAIVLLVGGWFAIEYGYFAGCEILMGGTTPGKRALSLRVVDAVGGRPGTRSLLVRNAVRSVDLLVGVVLMAADPFSRRLGDRLAGTLVVHEPKGGPELLVRRVPRGWSARDVATVESFFRRRAQLDPRRADELAQALLDAVRRDDPSLLAGLDGETPADAVRAALDVQGA